MVLVSGHVASIDFEDYNPSNVALHGQGTSPFLWSVTNRTGGPASSTGRARTKDLGAPSGIVIIRNNNATGPEKTSLCVLQSGIPPLSAEITKHIYQMDISVSQVGTHASKNDILLRPSGNNFDSGYHGWRAGFTLINNYIIMTEQDIELGGEEMD